MQAKCIYQWSEISKWSKFEDENTDQLHNEIGAGTCKKIAKKVWTVADVTHNLHIVQKKLCIFGISEVTIVLVQCFAEHIFTVSSKIVSYSVHSAMFIYNYTFPVRFLCISDVLSIT